MDGPASPNQRVWSFKSICDGCRSINDMISNLQGEIDELRGLQGDGFELKEEMGSRSTLRFSCFPALTFFRFSHKQNTFFKQKTEPDHGILVKAQPPVPPAKEKGTAKEPEPAKKRKAKGGEAAGGASSGAGSSKQARK